MTAHVEAAGAAGRRPTSEIFLGGNTSDLEQTPNLCKQTAWLARRFNLSGAVARVLAEHAFNQGKLR